MFLNVSIGTWVNTQLRSDSSCTTVGEEETGNTYAADPHLGGTFPADPHFTILITLSRLVNETELREQNKL